MRFDPKNILLMTDGYKPSHKSLYPKGIEYLQSYFESRVGAKWDGTVFFGLQYYIKEYLVGQVVTEERIQEAKKFFQGYFTQQNIFDEDAWRYILEKHKGKLPIQIRAVAEGTVVPNSCAMMVLENTDPQCAWLVNYLETLLVKVWYPCTVATQSREIRRNVIKHLLASGGTPEMADWMVHDFGYRGSTSEESAALGGAAHLLSFYGSDTIAGNLLLRNYYLSDADESIVSGSIPASEHSTVTTWGEGHEDAFMKNALETYPTGLLANVTDSYDSEQFVTVHAHMNKSLILNRDGKYVFRPDSGDPKDMSLKHLDWIGNRLLGGEGFGWTKNGKGFKVLHPKVGLIYGDGMNFESIDEYYANLVHNGWAAQNSAVGSGGGLLQKVDRDTQRFAFKACWTQINGESVDVYKKPSSDITKASKRGRLVVLPYSMMPKLSMVTYTEGQAKELKLDLSQDLLIPVYKDGNLITEYTLSEIRERVKTL